MGDRFVGVAAAVVGRMDMVKYVVGCRAAGVFVYVVIGDKVLTWFVLGAEPKVEVGTGVPLRL